MNGLKQETNEVDRREGWKWDMFCNGQARHPLRKIRTNRITDNPDYLAFDKLAVYRMDLFFTAGRAISFRNQHETQAGQGFISYTELHRQL